MEPWTLENSVIRLLAGVHVLAAALALLVLTVTILFALAVLGGYLTGRQPFTLTAAWTFIWIFSGLGVAAVNFVWSLDAIKQPNWHLVAKVTCLSMLILLVCPFVWRG